LVSDTAFRLLRPMATIALLLAGGSAFAGPKVHQKPSDFIKSSLGAIPTTHAITLTATQQQQVRAILGKNYKTKAIRYWERNGKSAFILEEIGKTEAITTGVVVKNRKIETVKVLVYRESHGWEVARSAFTNQFQGTSLKSNGQISRSPRNIAGATLSVRALTKLARLALFLDSQK
jgi:hypothetical protein